MITQTLPQPLMLSNLIVAPSPNYLSEQPISASSRDYGFDFDNQELARELLAPLPTDLSAQPTLEVNVDEFESHYIWFVS